MTTRAYTVLEAANGGKEMVVEWAGLLNGENGAPVILSGPARTFFWEVTGTFGTGGSVSMRGAASAIYSTLIQVNNSAATFTAAGATATRGSPRRVAPFVTAGDGTTNLTVRLYCTLSTPDG